MDDLRELDIKVAEALGYKHFPPPAMPPWQKPGSVMYTLPHYRTDIAVATEVKEYLYSTHGIWLSTGRLHDGRYVAGEIQDVADWDWWKYWSIADTESEAICHAFLAAMSDVKD